MTLLQEFSPEYANKLLVPGRMSSVSIETMKQSAAVVLTDMYGANEQSDHGRVNSYVGYVWFWSYNGLPLFNDLKLKYDVFFFLIQHQLIEYDGMSLHQGSEMLRYKLSRTMRQLPGGSDRFESHVKDLLPLTL